MTERLARAAARRPKRTLAIWGIVLVVSIAAIAVLLPSALTTDSEVTSSAESTQGYEVIRERIPRPPTDEFVNELVLVRAPGRDVTTDPQVRASVEGLV